MDQAVLIKEVTQNFQSVATEAEFFPVETCRALLEGYVTGFLQRMDLSGVADAYQAALNALDQAEKDEWDAEQGIVRS